MALAIKKINKKENIVETLKNNLGIPLPLVPYPVKSMEPWRRFDLNSLSTALSEASKTPSVTQVQSNGSGAYQLKTLEEWKKEDEIFAKKVSSVMKKMPADPAKDFFEAVALSYISENDVPVLRIKAEAGAGIDTLTFSKSEGLNIFNAIIFVENGASGAVYAADPDLGFGIGTIRIYQEANSTFEFQYMAEKGESGESVNYIKSYQEEDSSSRYGIFTMNRRNSKFFFENILQRRAHTDYNGFHTGNASKNDHDFYVLHKGSDSTSNIYFKMAMVDHAYSTFWGQTNIISGTFGCDAVQLNKNLLLGKSSRVDAIPKLEIDTEDVAASHGSATGEISDEEIFYLMSRGLSAAEAKKLLVYGFIEDVFQRAFREKNSLEENDFLKRIWEKTLDIVNIEVQ